MYILVLLIFLTPQEPVQDQFVFANQKECQRAAKMVRAISRFRALVACQPLV